MLQGARDCMKTEYMMNQGPFFTKYKGKGELVYTPPLCDTVLFARNPKSVHPDMWRECNSPEGVNAKVTTFRIRQSAKRWVC